jgi:hypothetical protein
MRRARVLTLVPYLAGGALYVIAGLLNPMSPVLVLISAAAASFGGTSALTWMTAPLHGSRYPRSAAPPLSIPRSPAWIVAGLCVAVVYVGVLGPSIRF